MLRNLHFLGFPIVLLLINRIALAQEKFAELDPQRIDAIAAMLPAGPGVIGRPCSDRAAWEDPRVQQEMNGVVKQAEALLGKPFPPFDDAAYLEFSKIGRRPRGEAMLRARDEWLFPLVIAECLENKGRFIPQLDVALDAYAKQTSWTLPAHDGALNNFHGKRFDVELRSSTFANQLGQALYLMGDKIDPGTRRRVMDSLALHVFDPTRQALHSGNGQFWLTDNNNWNAVCLAGVTGAALAVLPDRTDRAVFAAAGEHYCSHYMTSYYADGFCKEGAGYWGYGFSAFTRLREELARATGGQLDLFSDSRIRNMAMYGARIQMINHQVPPFEDCRFGATIPQDLLNYLNRTLALGLPAPEKPIGASHHDLVTACIDLFPGPLATGSAAGQGAEALGLGDRTYFKDAGVLICRPAAGSNSQLSVAIKGGGGGASHSHNDVGSFVIALGKEEPVGDPGGPVAYTNKTFGPGRYTIFKSLNSFGHPVPVVAGKLQIVAAKAHPKVLETRFTDAEDEIKIDIASAYDVPELTKLVRTLRYSRDGQGSVVVEDEVAFSSPQTFEIGLPSHGTWVAKDDKTIEFTMGNERLDATIETPDGFAVTSEVVEEMDEMPFTRIGIKLNKPITEGVVRITFRPDSQR